MWCRRSCLADKGMGHVLKGSYNAIMHERDIGNLDRWGLPFAMELHELRHDSVIIPLHLHPPLQLKVVEDKGMMVSGWQKTCFKVCDKQLLVLRLDGILNTPLSIFAQFWLVSAHPQTILFPSDDNIRQK